MGPATARLLLSSMLAATLTASAQQVRPQQSPVITIRLAAIQPTAKLHGPIKVRVTLTNQSNTRISFNDNIWGNYRFNVSDGNATLEPISRAVLMQRRSPFAADRMLSSEFDVYSTVATLEPGATREEEITISELFSFNRAGTYRIQAIHPDPVSNEPVTSNPVSVTVVP